MALEQGCTAPFARTRVPDDVPDDVCVDGDVNCEWWASTGECSTDPDYMHVKCKKSCSICSTAGSDGHVGPWYGKLRTCPGAPDPVGSMVECWRPTKQFTAAQETTYKCGSSACVKLSDPAMEVVEAKGAAQGLYTTGGVLLGIGISFTILVGMVIYKIRAAARAAEAAAQPAVAMTAVPAQAQNKAAAGVTGSVMPSGAPATQGQVITVAQPVVAGL